MRLACCIAALVLLVCGPARAQLSPDLQARLSKQGHALIIAQWDYSDPRFHEPYTVQQMTKHQAEELQAGLDEHFSTVERKDNLRYEDLRRELRTFFIEKGSDPKTRLLVFYIGHGFPDLSNNNGFITGTDTPYPSGDRSNARLQSISMPEYDSFAGQAHAAQVLTIFDACFSGTILWSGFGGGLGSAESMDEQVVRGVLADPVRYYITAGDHNEEVPAEFDFARVVLDGIRGAATGPDGRFVTGERLGVYLKDTVPKTSGVLVHPQAGPVNDPRYRRGQFVFAAARAMRPSPPSDDKLLRDAIGRCDELAASPYDLRRPPSVPGVDFDRMDGKAAVAACSAAMATPGFTRLTAETSVRVQAELGRAYVKAGEDKKAVALFRLAAEQGNAPAQNNLGFIYEGGRGGLTRSDADAVRLYRLAADQGYAPAQYNLGSMHAEGRGGLATSDADAVRLFRLAADQGYALAQSYLGVMYEGGRGGLPKSDADAVRLFRLAADQGDAFAQGYLGVMYEGGRGGLPKSDADAVRLFRLAADQGDAFAQSYLGVMYEGGRGVSQSMDEAVRLYQIAARAGDETAKQNLRRLNKSW